ncbi:MAG: zinc ribbon domain-containing protein [Myxococcota bacterium]
MRCPNCGADNESSSLFCMECGQKLQVKTEVMSGLQKPPAAATDSNSKKPQKKQKTGSNSQQNTISCPLCGIDNSASDSFCKMCGQELKPEPDNSAKCQRCNTKIGKNDKFCPNCGAKTSNFRNPTPPAGLEAAKSPVDKDKQAKNSKNIGSTQSFDNKQIIKQQTKKTSRLKKQAQTPAQSPSSPSPEKKQINKTIIQVPTSKNDNKPGRTIRIINGSRNGEKFSFTRSLTFGKTNGDINLDSDDYLDARHLAIAATKTGIKVSNLSNVNGVYYRVTGKEEIFFDTPFLLNDLLMQVEKMESKERSLNSIWQEGVKLMGSLRELNPWGRLRLFSSIGVTYGTWLLFEDQQDIGKRFFPGLEFETIIYHKNNRIYLKAGQNKVFYKLSDTKEFSLPIQLKLGLEELEITSF